MSMNTRRGTGSVEPQQDLAARLQQCENRLRLATEAGGVGLWDYDPSTGLMTCCARTRAMLGISPGGETNLAAFTAGLHPGDREATVAAFVAATDPQTRLAFDLEFRTTCAEDQAVHWVAARGHGLFDDDGCCRRAIGSAIDITARRRTETRLAASEARFHAAVDAVEGILWTNNARGEMEGEQPGWTTLTGQTEDQYSGQGWISAVHLDDAKPTIEAWQTALATRQLFVHEHRVRRRDGVWRRFSVRVIPSLEQDGSLREWVGLHTDITAREAAEVERTKLTALVEQSGDLIGIAGLDQRVSFLNAAGCRLVGLDPATVHGTLAEDFLPDAQKTLLDTEIVQAVQSGGHWQGDLLLRHFASGTTIPVWSNVFVLRSGDGIAVGFGTVARDLTAQHRADDALRGMNETLERLVAERTAALASSEARLRAIFETSYQLQCMVTPDGELVDANETSLKAACCTMAELAGRPFWETAWFSATPGMAELIHQGVQLAASGQTVRQEITVNLPGGRRTYDFSIRPIHGAAGDVFALIPDAIDITDRLASEDALRQAQKMEAFGQLTGGVAHDFNNLLQAISGGLEMLGRNHVQSADGQQLIGLISNAIDRGAQLTRQLLAFARKSQLELQPVDVNAVIAASGALLESSMGGALVVERVFGRDLWPAMTDPSQLDVAILNLMINARDATPGGGTVTISTANAVAPGPGVPDDLRPGGYVRLAVADTGTGMSETVLERVFEPFFTTKDVGKGTGLGLSQVYGFAHQSSGTVRVASMQGRGTTVEIFLPRADAEPDGPASRFHSGKAPDGREPGFQTVLVVDDDRDVCELAAASLSELGYTVLTAESGSAGLEVIGREPGLELLLVDFAMPGMNGAELVRRARQLRPGLRVVFMTGHTDAVAPFAGTHDILYKPFKLADLAARVKQALIQG